MQMMIDRWTNKPSSKAWWSYLCFSPVWNITNNINVILMFTCRFDTSWRTFVDETVWAQSYAV